MNELLGKAPFNLEEIKRVRFKRCLWRKRYNNERTGIRPTFDVCGIWGGYTGEGSQNSNSFYHMLKFLRD